MRQTLRNAAAEARSLAATFNQVHGEADKDVESQAGDPRPSTSKAELLIAGAAVAWVLQDEVCSEQSIKNCIILQLLGLSHRRHEAVHPGRRALMSLGKGARAGTG